MASKAAGGIEIKWWQLLLIGAATGLLTLTLTAFSRATTGFAARDEGAMSAALLIHLATVLPALPLGAYLLLRRKGDRLHRWLGRTWAALMVTTAISTFWLTGPNGQLSFIHIFSLVTFISIPRAVLAIRRGDTRRTGSR
jgi:uncharacterized membrane protein